jgi:hypothetical protein
MGDGDERDLVAELARCYGMNATHPSDPKRARRRQHQHVTNVAHHETVGIDSVPMDRLDLPGSDESRRMLNVHPTNRPASSIRNEESENQW